MSVNYDLWLLPTDGPELQDSATLQECDTCGFVGPVEFEDYGGGMTITRHPQEGYCTCGLCTLRMIEHETDYDGPDPDRAYDEMRERDY